MSVSNTVFLVVPAKGGWAVNHGADTVSLHAKHAEATAHARLMSRQAVDEGEASSVVDIECCADDSPPSKPL